MTVALSPIGGAGEQFVDTNGIPYSGGKLYTYIAGSTTPQATYSDNLGVNPNTNPIILGSDGRVSSGGVYLIYGAVYKFVLKTSADVLVASWDNITGATLIPGPAGPTGATGPQGSAGTIPPGFFNVKDYGAVGDDVTDDTAAIQSAVNAAVAAGVSAAPYTGVYFPPGCYKVTSLISYNSEISLLGSAASGGPGPSNLYDVRRGSVIRFHGAGGFECYAIFNNVAYEIANLSFENASGSPATTAIWIKDNGFAHIHDCTFFNLYEGIKLQNSASNIINACTFYFNEIPIHLFGASRTVVSGNLITQYGDATSKSIFLDNSSDYNNITGNVISAGGIGIHCLNSKFCSITGNTISCSGGVSPTTIGVKLDQSGSYKTNATVVGNTIDIGVDAWAIGIDVQSAENCNIQSNVIRATTALNFAVGGTKTCGGTYYNGNIFPEYSAGAMGQVIVGGGVTATAGTNINGV